tara:strand:+ start:67 stop:327 length:261 start_codon:yes stop_codon:yes gene_type:complete
MKNNKNNIDKRLEATSDRSTAKEIMKLATDYKDPEQVELELSLDLMDSFREQYREMVKEGYKASFLDFLKSEIATKRKYRAGGLVK